MSGSATHWIIGLAIVALILGPFLALRAGAAFKARRLNRSALKAQPYADVDAEADEAWGKKK